MIGKWSVEVGLNEASTSHLITKSSIPGVLKTLSGHEYLLDHICWRVGTLRSEEHTSELQSL